jgi:hypothetical protein
MRIVFLIFLLETLALTLWMARRWLSINSRANAPVVALQRPANPSGNYPTIEAAATSLDAAHWAFINKWELPAQEDDRTPMNGSVTNSRGRPSARRASARASHQANYKVWSQERHD